MDDSYTMARIRAMKSELLKDKDFGKMQNMSEKEMMAFLLDTRYSEDIRKLKVNDFDNLEVIDRILASNQRRTLEKLSRISSENFEKELQNTLIMNDIWNLKVIAEAISGGEDPTNALEEYGRYGPNRSDASRSKSIKELSAHAKEHLARNAPENLPEFLDALNSNIDIQDPYLLDEHNIGMVLRLKREGKTPEQVMSRIKRTGTIGKGTLMKAAKATDMNGTIDVFKETPYGKAFEDPSMVTIEDNLHKQVVDRLRHHARSEPLGILQQYLAEHDLEQERLRYLVKARRLGVAR